MRLYYFLRTGQVYSSEDTGISAVSCGGGRGHRRQVTHPPKFFSGYGTHWNRKW